MSRELPRLRTLTALLLLAPALAAAQANEGTYDPAFAGAGHFVFGYIRPGSPVLVAENFYTLAVDTNDRIVVAGDCFGTGMSTMCAARHQPDGGADATFADYGDGLYFFGVPGSMTDSFVQADGSTVLCGSFNNGVSSVAYVARLTPQGLLDTSAAGAPSGIRSVPFPSGTVAAGGRCAPGPDSSTYVVATVNGSAGGGTQDIAVARLDNELQLDLAFSDDGYAIAAVDLAAVNSEYVADVAVAADGGPVLVGADRNIFDIPSTSEGWVICALLADGTPRDGFGASGCRLYRRPDDPFTGGTELAAGAVAIDRQQRILVTGTTTLFPRAAVGRFLLDGTPDPTFNGGTYQVLPVIGIDQNFPPAAVLEMPGGRILAATSVVPGNPIIQQISVSGILADGTGPDPTFGTGGQTLITDGTNPYIFGSMVLQGDRPLITGFVRYMNDNPPANGLLVRLRGDQLLTDGFE